MITVPNVLLHDRRRRPVRHGCGPDRSNGAPVGDFMFHVQPQRHCVEADIYATDMSVLCTTV